jgi:hypothetical protein
MNAGQLWDPYSSTYSNTDGGPVRSAPIPNNRIDLYMSPGNPNLPANLQPTPGLAGNLIDPVAQAMLKLFPTANNQGQGIYNNWIASGATPSSNNQFDLKIDHRFSDKNLLSGRYSQRWGSNGTFNCFKTFIDPCGGAPSKTTAHVFTLNDSYSFSPTLLLTTTLGFTRGSFRANAYNSSLNPDPLATLGFPSYLKANGFNGVPAVFLSDYVSAGFPNAGNDPYGNYKQGKDTGQLSVLLSKIHGSHDLKFGFEGRLHQMNYIQTNAPLGYFNFDNRGTSICPSPGVSSNCNDGQVAGGDAMASLLMGQIESGYYEIQFQPATENYQYAALAQDNWKATPKLTLNLGLRYDVSLPRTDRFNRANWFDPNAVNPLHGGTISYQDPLTFQNVTRPLLGGELFANSNTRTNYLTDWRDIQPRFGFAFQFAPKMVLRGGYGIYYGQSRSGASGVVPYGSQGFNQYTNVITTYQSDKATPYLHLNNPFPSGLKQPTGSSLGLLNDVGFAANGPLRTRAADLTPYEQSWTLGIERQLPWNVILNVEYLGKKGTHLPFSGANQLDILGPQVETYTAGQISNLNTLVNNPFFGVIKDQNSNLSVSQVPGYQLEVPYPQFDESGGNGVTTDVQMIGSSIYHGLQISADKHFSNGLEFLVNYTWSKSIDDSSIGDDNVTWLGSFTSLQDPNKPWLERSLSTFDTPSVLKFSYSYDLPIGRGKSLLGNMPRVLEAIIGGWKTNGIWLISDGRPLAVTVSNGGTALPTYGAQRPNIVGSPKRNRHDWVDNFFVDPTVFQTPAPFTLGTAPRAIASVRTPLTFTTDLSVSKQFLLSRVHEGIRMELRLEAQNAFNHPLFSLGTPGPYSGNGTLNVGDQGFGILTSMSPVGPRQVQLALKINF